MFKFVLKNYKIGLHQTYSINSFFLILKIYKLNTLMKVLIGKYCSEIFC